MNEQAFILTIAAVIVVGVFAALVARWRESNKAIRHEPATLITKRATTNGFPAGVEQTVSKQYFATFELRSGRRLEFTIGSREFGLFAEGDAGTLSRRGRRFLGFDRERV